MLAHVGSGRAHEPVRFAQGGAHKPIGFAQGGAQSGSAAA